MDDRTLLLALRIAWLLLPVLIGGALAAGAADLDRSVELTAAGLAWLVWADGLLALLVPSALSLTALRVAAPLPLLATVGTLVNEAGGTGSIEAGAGLAGSSLVVALAFTPQIGARLVDGSSYGDERRWPLRVPPALLLGPIPLLWLVSAGGVLAAPLLVATGSAVPAALALPLAAAVPFALRRLHLLSQRWIVFVPAGVVLHDQLALADPVLFTKRSIERLGPAPADSTARDLSGGAAGLVLELRLREPVGVVPAARRGLAQESTQIDAFLFTPSLPATVLAEASRRGIATDRAPT